MNDQLNQTNSRRYDSFTTRPVRSAILSNSWPSCY